MPRSAMIQVMARAAEKAGRSVLRDFGELDKLHVSRKGVGDFATAADQRAERILHQELSKARPGFSFLMEESGEVPGSDLDQRFVIDPIDGTNNFIHAVPYFCVSIAFEKRLKNGKFETQAGVIYDPIQNELFIAELHQGATLNDRRMIASNRTDPERCMLASFVPASGEALEARLHRRITQSPYVMRVGGATALDLAYVAAGRYDGAFHAVYHHWDVAAGKLLVREAGGRVSEHQENTPSWLLCSNAPLHDKLLSAMAPALAA